MFTWSQQSNTDVKLKSSVVWFQSPLSCSVLLNSLTLNPKPLPLLHVSSPIVTANAVHSQLATEKYQQLLLKIWWGANKEPEECSSPYAQTHRINYTWSSNLKFVFTIDKNNSFTLSLISPRISPCSCTTQNSGSPSHWEPLLPKHLDIIHTTFYEINRNKILWLYFMTIGQKGIAKGLTSITTWVSV